MNLLKLTIITTFLLTIFPSQTLAQTPDPNRDRLIQPPEEQLPTPVDEEPIFPQPEQQQEPLPNTDDTFTFPLQQLQILGSTIFTTADFDPIISPLEGQQVSLSQLQGVADAITKLYFDAGYVNSRAILTRQAIEEGIVTIQVIEGSLADIEINGLKRTKPQYVLSRINEGVTTPLNIQDLEDKLRLLKTDPLFSDIKIELQPGTEPGETILALNITEAKPFYGNVFVDNYSSASIGSERMGITLGYRNLTGLGDNFRANYTRSTTGGSDIFDLGYTMPVNAKNGTVQLRFVSDNNEVTQAPFNQLGIQGESQLYEVSFRQPLMRTSLEEFALSVGFAHRTGQTFIFENIGTPFGVGAEADGTTRTTVIRFAQDYVRRDITGAWAVRSQFNLGTGLFDATSNSGNTPDGQFFSWLGQVQRVQRLSADNLLIMQIDGQLTPDNLLGSEAFTIGGGTTVRGYRQGARAGDNGVRFTVEDRITLERDEDGASVFQLAPFFDMGVVFDSEDNPNVRPSQNFLAGLGLGVLWSPMKNVNLRLDGTLPLVNLDDRGENAQDDGFYFSLNFNF